jgi:hypothetical protein
MLGRRRFIRQLSARVASHAPENDGVAALHDRAVPLLQRAHLLLHAVLWRNT